MNSDAVIMFALTLTSVTLCISLVVGWATLGRPMHALLWAAAFGTAGLQWGLMARPDSLEIGLTAGTMISCCLGVVVTLFLLAGFRARAGRPLSPKAFILVAGACAVVIGVALAGGQVDVARATPHLSRALLLLWAALTVSKAWRTTCYTEMFASGVLTVFALFSLLVGVLRVAHTGDAGELAHLLVMVGLPATFANLGAAILLLLASDLGGKLERLAITDPLTGVLNRRGFETKVQALGGRMKRSAVLILDVDGFKAVNDSLGHAVGDRVLTAVAACLSHAVRDGDIVGRLGGDEFVVLLVEAGASDAQRAADRIRAVLASGTADGLDGALPHVSIGIAPLSAGPFTLSLAMADADRALYRSKMERRGTGNPAASGAPKLNLVRNVDVTNPTARAAHG